jgi:hypothetical protein
MPRRAFIDLTGKQLGTMTVVRRVKVENRPNSNYSAYRWLCRCNLCGREKLVWSFNLIAGHPKSCGGPGRKSRCISAGSDSKPTE